MGSLVLAPKGTVLKMQLSANVSYKLSQSSGYSNQSLFCFMYAADEGPPTSCSTTPGRCDQVDLW